VLPDECGIRVRRRRRRSRVAASIYICHTMAASQDARVAGPRQATGAGPFQNGMLFIVRKWRLG
jgi:hypothetical protein